MYVIVEAGGKQYKLAAGDQILIEQAVSPGTRKLTLDKVLLAVKDKTVKLGEPYLKDIKVNCEVVRHLKGKKKVAYKYRRRKSSHSKKGQRPRLVLVKVKDIASK